MGNLTEVPWRQVAEHLEALLDGLHSVLSTIQSGFDRDNRSLGLFNLGFRAARELQRAISWLLEPNDLLAWCVRNLFELDLTLRRVTDSDDALKLWTGQMLKDEQDIVQGFRDAQRTVCWRDERARRSNCGGY